MINIDLLFTTDADKTRLSEGYIDDVFSGCLDKIFSQSEYREFAATLAAPLADPEKIVERQRILRDFAAAPSLIDELMSLCADIANAKNNDSTRDKFKLYVGVLDKTVDLWSGFPSILEARPFESKTLKNLCAELDISLKLKALRDQIKTYHVLLNSGKYTLAVSYGGSFKLSDASLMGAADECYAPTESRGLFKKKQIKPAPGWSFIVPGDHTSPGDYITPIQLAEIHSRAVENLVSVTGGVVSAVKNAAARLFSQLKFYYLALKLADKLKSLSVPTCFPTFGGESIAAESLLDIGLAVNLEDGKSVVGNDIAATRGGQCLISGANSGGKTTFLKSVGAAQLFAQCGLFVCAKAYKCCVFDNLLTHFPREEDGAFAFGKLAEELTRLRELLPKMRSRALIMLNESLSTTTEEEGAEIARDLLRALKSTDATVFFVTHNLDLLSSRDRIGARSLVVQTSKNNAERSYKIVDGPPSDNIHGFEFVMERIKNDRT